VIGRWGDIEAYESPVTAGNNDSVAGSAIRHALPLRRRHEPATLNTSGVQLLNVPGLETCC
jgi:hypothetical protein